MLMPAKNTATIISIVMPFCGDLELTPHSCLSKSSCSRLVSSGGALIAGFPIKVGRANAERLFVRTGIRRSLFSVSAFTSKADIDATQTDVRLVPIADFRRQQNLVKKEPAEAG